jgi:hypothetical protein
MMEKKEGRRKRKDDERQKRTKQQPSNTTEIKKKPKGVVIQTFPVSSPAKQPNQLSPLVPLCTRLDWTGLDNNQCSATFLGEEVRGEGGKTDNQRDSSNKHLENCNINYTGPWSIAQSYCIIEFYSRTTAPPPTMGVGG